MIATELDYAPARANMVDSQLRPNKVTDPRLLAAFRSVPRERFVPQERAALAYADEDIRLAGGRVLMQPMVLARLLQALAPQSGERALVIGAGAGYSAAILAQLGLSVIALEDDAALPMKAASAAISPVSGPLTAGWPAAAPYDVILIDGGITALPDAITAQIAPAKGRLGTVLHDGPVAQAVLVQVFAGRPAITKLFDCATPVLPGFRRAPGFVF